MGKNEFFGNNLAPHKIAKKQKGNKNLTLNTGIATKEKIGRVWQYFKKCKLQMIIAVILSIIGTAANVTSIYFMSVIYDKYFMANPPPEWAVVFSTFCMICILSFICYVINNLTNYLVTIVMLRVSEYHVCYDMRKDVFGKLQKLPVKYFDTHPSGELITRTSNDIDNISLAVSQYIVQDIFWMFLIIGIIILMFLINWALALITLIIYPFMILATSKLTGFIRPYFAKQQNEVGKLNSFVEERVSGVKIVSLYEKENLNAKEFGAINDNLTKNSIIANAFSNVLNPLNAFFNNFSFVILAALGISLVATGAINIGWGALHYQSVSALLIIFTIFARNLTNPINQIVLSFGPIILATVSAQRVFEILDQKEETDPANAIELKKLKGVVEAKNMYFGYDSSRMILKNINFKAVPDKVTALVGPTGAGKTTIVSLITKFYDINKGDLLIDGKSIKNIKRDSLRRNITSVLQDTFLFSKTIRENIRYGRLDATDDEVEQAAKLAHADEFIRTMPHGYETILDDNGNNLSQGQRQLLAIARAFLADSRIVILDEASSSIDTKTELDVQEALKKLMHNRTTFMIAHRLSTIRDADNILVLKEGEIIEHGKHDELMKKKGFYYQLYNAQLKKGETI